VAPARRGPNLTGDAHIPPSLRAAEQVDTPPSSCSGHLPPRGPRLRALAWGRGNMSPKPAVISLSGSFKSESWLGLQLTLDQPDFFWELEPPSRQNARSPPPSHTRAN
jgi:hypothetical protein